MSVHSPKAGVIELSGHCPLEDAETLQQHLMVAQDATIDWRACETAHTAVIQVLLAARPKLLGPPIGGFLKERVAVMLDTSTT